MQTEWYPKKVNRLIILIEHFLNKLCMEIKLTFTNIWVPTF